jgi:hypothetical protein
MRRLSIVFAIAAVFVIQGSAANGGDFVPAQAGCGAGLPFGPDPGLTNTGTFRLGNASCETAWVYGVDEGGNKAFHGELPAGTSSYYQATPPGKVCVTFSITEYQAGSGGACFTGPQPFIVDGAWGSSPIQNYIFNKSVDALYKVRARINAYEKLWGRRVSPIRSKSAVVGVRS